MSEALTAFDEIPYQSFPVPATYPPQLALSSRIHGGPYPPTEGYRLLELGCGDASNLLPLAFYQPDSEFVGIDCAATALERGRSSAVELGLSNLHLTLNDFSHPSFELDGTFDYVVVHGVFSWISEAHRNQLLRICRSSLSRDGLVYLSYNVQPAWKLRGLVRDLLKAAVATVEVPRLRVKGTKELAAELRDLLLCAEHPYQNLMARELGRVVECEESYVYHEYLCEENSAFSVHELADLTRTYDLEYVCDAMFNKPEGRMPEPLVELLSRWGFRDLDLEQQVDVLGYRQFRASVLCIRGQRQRVPNSYPMLQDLWLACGSSPTSEMSVLRMNAEEKPAGHEGQVLLADPLLATILTRLRHLSPYPVAVTEAIEEAGSSRKDVGNHRVGREELCTQLLDLHRKGIVELSPVAPSKRPAEGRVVPHALARFEAARGSVATTPFHTLYPLDEFDREIIRRLGEQDSLDSVISKLLTRPETEALVREDPDTGCLESATRQAAEASLARMQRWGLFSTD